MDTIALARQLMSHDTVSPVTSRDPYEPVIAVLEDAGIDHTVHEEGDVVNLTARTGNGEPHVCLNGHLDVVPPGNGWTVTEPFDPVVEGGTLYGRGAADMKAALAAQIMAFVDLAQDPSFDGTATLMVVGDEEEGGFDGTQPLVERFPDIDYALIGEATDMDIQVGTRGVLWLDIHLEEDEVHASRPHLTDNVLEQAGAIIDRLGDISLSDAEDEELPAPTATVTVVEADTTQNSIPGEARIGMDIRYVPAQSEESLITDVRDALAPLDLDYRIETVDHGGAFTLEDDHFREVATEVLTEVRGEPPEHITDGGASDGRFFAERGTPFIELGVNQEPVHQHDEHCQVETLPKLRQAYRDIAARL